MPGRRNGSRLLNNSDLRSTSMSTLPRARRSHQLMARSGCCAFSNKLSGRLAFHSWFVENSLGSFFAGITFVPQVIQILRCQPGFAASLKTDTRHNIACNVARTPITPCVQLQNCCTQNCRQRSILCYMMTLFRETCSRKFHETHGAVAANSWRRCTRRMLFYFS